MIGKARIGKRFSHTRGTATLSQETCPKAIARRFVRKRRSEVASSALSFATFVEREGFRN